MYKEDVVYMYNRISFNHENKGNPTIFDKMDETDGTILRKILEQDEHYVVSFIYRIYKKVKLIEQRVEKWLPRAGRWGKEGETGKRVQDFSYKMSKFSTSNENMVTTWYCIIAICLREWDLNVLTHTK